MIDWLVFRFQFLLSRNLSKTNNKKVPHFHLKVRLMHCLSLNLKNMRLIHCLNLDQKNMRLMRAPRLMHCLSFDPKKYAPYPLSQLGPKKYAPYALSQLGPEKYAPYARVRPIHANIR